MTEEPLSRDAPETEERRRLCEFLYEFEMEARRQGFLADPALAYDEEHEIFRFRDGTFAFSREHANWALLKKRVRLKGFDGILSRSLP